MGNRRVDRRWDRVDNQWDQVDRNQCVQVDRRCRASRCMGNRRWGIQVGRRWDRVGRNRWDRVDDRWDRADNRWDRVGHNRWDTPDNRRCRVLLAVTPIRAINPDRRVDLRPGRLPDMVRRATDHGRRLAVLINGLKPNL